MSYHKMFRELKLDNKRFIRSVGLIYLHRRTTSIMTRRQSVGSDLF